MSSTYYYTDDNKETLRKILKGTYGYSNEKINEIIDAVSITDTKERNEKVEELTGSDFDFLSLNMSSIEDGFTLAGIDYTYYQAYIKPQQDTAKTMSVLKAISSVAKKIQQVGRRVKKYVSDSKKSNQKPQQAVKPQYAKTSFWERLNTKKLSVDKLVGNLKDEFMNPKIGPSETALSNHMKYIRENGTINEPILVKKLTNGTYEIQNGHHRWLAAKKMGLKKVPVEVMK